MSVLRPRQKLGTHEVFNQTPPLGDLDLWATDPALREAVSREGEAVHEQRVHDFARLCGSESMQEHAFRANRWLPELKSFDRYGRRIDEVDFHPSYHALMQVGLDGGVSSVAWSEATSGHVLHSALFYLMAELEPSVCCPMSMTYAAVPALQATPSVAERWIPPILASRYDSRSRPAAEKRGVTVGMAMTEKQGGSDVRGNTTRATRDGDGYRLYGHKWFCSAPMSDAFLTLAYSEEGLTCFLVPRWTPDGERNPFHIMRLKDKLGDRANASSEIEYHDTWATIVGPPGRGISTIIAMVHHTRLDCAIAPAAFMHRTILEAFHHARHRSAFGKRLVESELMEKVLADLVLESEATTALTFRLARAFDEAERGDERARSFARIATPVAKYWHNKRVVPTVHEAMEVHGGAGFVEESLMPRYYRQAPLNGIWEGSGNVMCLDVLRAASREPEAITILREELQSTRGEDPDYDEHLRAWLPRLEPSRLDQSSARSLVEALGLALQANVLLASGASEIAHAFCRTRIGASRAVSFGAYTGELPIRVLMERVPEL